MPEAPSLPAPVAEVVPTPAREAAPVPPASSAPVRPMRVTAEEREAANRILNNLENSRSIQQRTTRLILSGSAFVVLMGGGAFLGYRFWRHEQWGKAMAVAGEARRTDYAKKNADVSPEARFALEDAERLKQANNTSEAAKALERASSALDAGRNGKDSPTDLKVAVKNRQGMMLGQSGSFTLAAKAFREALALAPSNADIQVNLAVALIGAGTNEGKKANYAEAIKILRKAVAAHPDDLRGRYNLAKALSLSGNDYEASREQAEFLARSNAASKGQAAATPAPNGQAAGMGAALGSPTATP